MYEDNKQGEKNGRIEEGWVQREAKRKTNKRQRQKHWGAKNGFVHGWEEKGKRRMEGNFGGVVGSKNNCVFLAKFCQILS
jgi:hypothetical protein